MTSQQTRALSIDGQDKAVCNPFAHGFVDILPIFGGVAEPLDQMDGKQPPPADFLAALGHQPLASPN